MCRLGNRSRPGRRRRGWGNYRHRFSREDRGAAKQLYGQLLASTVAVKRNAILRTVLLVTCAAWSLVGATIFASAEIDEAARAIDDGIPEVAVVRLQKLADT